jgi:hypothetical protein
MMPPHVRQEVLGKRLPRHISPEVKTMKRFQSLLASFLLAFVLAAALAASAAASAGTIHTGYAPPQPTPTPENIIADDDPIIDETGEGERAAREYVLEAMLDCLHAAFTLF